MSDGAPDSDVVTEHVGFAPTCPRCGYDLTGTLESSDQRCPECGRPWNVDELAAQRVADSFLGDRSQRILWAFGPGLIVVAILGPGLLFGAPVVYGAILLALVVYVAGIANWVTDLHHVSFARARSGLNRLLFVAGGALILAILNAMPTWWLIKCIALIVRLMSQ